MFVRVAYKEKERILINALKHAPLAKAEFSGSGVAPFVGRFGYPFVNVGLLAPPQIEAEAWKFDAPRFWAQTNHQIPEIVNYRAGLINSSQKSSVKQPEKVVEIAQEIAMATKPVDVDIQLEKAPRASIRPDQWTAPMGPQGKLKSIALTQNPHIPAKVEKFFDDKGALATEAITTLYQKEMDENSLARMLSIGVFGKQRKLVPTRWSITATDDMLANHFLEGVRELPIGDFAVYAGEYLGNNYLILMFPERWRYELFELYAKSENVQYSSDYERFEGRKDYAKNCAGGYYTVRMALAEYMKNQKRQSSVLALRFITDEYVLPLGVWVTREATRKALASKPILFGSKELTLTYAKHWAKKKFGIDIAPLLEKSNILKEKDVSLTDWA